MLYFFNYQAVPFSLAFAILLVLFVLETRPKNMSLNIVSALLFGTLLITHAFVPLFFILYLFLRSIIDKNKGYFLFFTLGITSYLVVQLTLGSVSFVNNLLTVMTKPSEFSSMVTVSFTPANPVLIDIIAQFFTRTVTVASVLICALAFVIMFIKKQLRNIDKAILLTGIIYSGLGIFLFTLGTRAVALAFIPVSLGAAYLFQNKRFRPFLVIAILILLVLCLFIPLRQTFANEIQFQTQEAYQSTNFLINHTNWEKVGSISTDYRTLTYIEAKLGFYPELSPDPSKADTVFYTQGLDKALLGTNYTIENLTKEGFNVVYNNGFSMILTQPKNK
jgi:hypothetical protein